jgi:hypothetical protein
MNLEDYGHFEAMQKEIASLKAQLAECKKEGLMLRRSVIRHRQNVFPHVDQVMVINREFPYLAAMAQEEA